jgi:hypothetical protein
MGLVLLSVFVQDLSKFPSGELFWVGSTRQKCNFSLFSLRSALQG